MPTYLLRNIDPELWAKVKARAQSQGHGLRWIMLALIGLYAHGALDDKIRQYREESQRLARTVRELITP